MHEDENELNTSMSMSMSRYKKEAWEALHRDISVQVGEYPPEIRLTSLHKYTGLSWGITRQSSQIFHFF